MISPPPFDPGHDPGQNQVTGSSQQRRATVPPSYHGNGPQTVRMASAEANAALPENPFLLQKSVEAFLGDKVLSANPEGRGMFYALKVKSRAQAEKLSEMTQLSDGTPVKFSPHPLHNTVRCVVTYRRLINATEIELLDDLKDQDVIEVRRITRKENGRIVNTPALILTVKGSERPQTINFGWELRETRPYYQSPMLCFNCWSFGHTKLKCIAAKLCGNCSTEHEDVVGGCKNPTSCSKCNTNAHSISSKKCPAYMREDAIQRIKTDRNITFDQARREWEVCNGPRSFANVTARPTAQDEAITALNFKMDALIEAMQKNSVTAAAVSAQIPNYDTKLAELTMKIDKLQEENARKDQQIKQLNEALKMRGTKTADERMNLARENKTIEDMMKRAELLQAALEASQAKERELRAKEHAKPAILNSNISGSEDDVILTDEEPFTNQKRALSSEETNGYKAVLRKRRTRTTKNGKSKNST